MSRPVTPTTSGGSTSPTSDCEVAGCTWLPFSTGFHAMWSAGRSISRWKCRSSWRPPNKHWRKPSPIFGIVTKEVILPALSIPKPGFSEGKTRLDADVRISMDGKNRALDNVFTERLWRTIKYEDVYLNDYGSPKEARQQDTSGLFPPTCTSVQQITALKANRMECCH